MWSECSSSCRNVVRSAVKAAGLSSGAGAGLVDDALVGGVGGDEGLDGQVVEPGVQPTAAFRVDRVIAVREVDPLTQDELIIERGGPATADRCELRPTASNSAERTQRAGADPDPISWPRTARSRFAPEWCEPRSCQDRR
jgi:hypothetical protein